MTEKYNIEVPDKTIAVFGDPFGIPWIDTDKDRLSNIIDKPSKKRSWFDPHFYRCLPLTIGNQYGFVIKSEFDFSFVWNGGNEVEDITLKFYEPKEDVDKKYPRISSHFGHGIITITTPFWLKTPPGINIMTINPPNYVIPNITVMTGVIETDNISRDFTFNLKIQMPNLEVFATKGSPLAAFIPIPRYFADSFELKYGDEIFDQSLVDKEIQTAIDTYQYREDVEKDLPNQVGKLYMRGQDIYGNKFKDHQSP